MPTTTPIPDELYPIYSKRMQEIYAELQNNAGPSEEARQFQEQLKREQERQLEAQQLLAEKRYVEAHWFDGKFRSKIRRGNNKQNHKKKGRK